jgi:hypothetical protein
MAQVVEERSNGVVVYQVTDAAALVSNIYCERTYAGADSQRFLYARQTDDGGAYTLDSWEYVLCEFGTWDEQVVGRGSLSCAVSFGNDYYYTRSNGKGAREFVRIDLDTGASDVVFERADDIPRAGHPGISPDGRYIAYHYALSFAPQMFAIELADTRTGTHEIIHRDQWLCNAHLQFQPTDNRTLLVQYNRGCEFRSDGSRVRLTGDQGATLFLLDALTRTVTPLQIGTPHTTPITGHEAWIGDSHEIIATVVASGEFGAGPGQGNIVVVSEGQPSRQLGTGVEMNHIGSTPCGTYFCADAIKGDDIVIGSPETGRTVAVYDNGDPADAGGSPFGQMSHPHAYLSPDFKWVVFNSDQTGRPQTYVAAIPPTLLAELA